MHWSFVVHGNKIIEWGTNRTGHVQTELGYNQQRAKIHSEVSAYKRAKGLMPKGDDFQMLNIRMNRLGELRMSAPCEICSGWLPLVGCSKVWFTTPSGWASIGV